MLSDMAVNEPPIRQVWLAVAQASAEHRRVTEASAAIFYDDVTLRNTAIARAWGELTRAIRAAERMAVAEEEVVDALCSGDPRLDVSEAVDLIAWVRSRDERVRELSGKTLADLLGEE
jgi:hypothetical protein